MMLSGFGTRPPANNYDISFSHTPAVHKLISTVIIHQEHTHDHYSRRSMTSLAFTMSQVVYIQEEDSDPALESERLLVY